jgi:alcohol dehydrogenase
MFYCPTRIIFGKEAMQKAGSYLEKLGTRPMIVCGKQSAKLCGALDDALAILKKQGMNATIFADISENPSLESIIAGKEMFLNQGCNLLIGIGGGSPIDAAKAISLAAANDLDAQQLYQTDLFTKAFPIVAIPTTSGTGSEATQYSVLTDFRQKKKAGFGHALAFPKLAVLDPKYTFSLPDIVTLHSALDALSHLLEGLYSNQRTPLVYPLIFKGIASIMKCLPQILQDKENYAAREELMQASLYGGMVIAQSSTTFQHAIGYPLTTHYNIPHGLANAMAMEAVMELYCPAVRPELEGLFAYLNCTYNSFTSWLKALPVQQHHALSDSFIEEAIPLVMSARNMALNPVEISEKQVLLVYEKIRMPQ